MCYNRHMRKFKSPLDRAYERDRLEMWNATAEIGYSLTFRQVLAMAEVFARRWCSPWVVFKVVTLRKLHRFFFPPWPWEIEQEEHRGVG